MDPSYAGWTTARFTRRRMLLIAGAAAGTGLVALGRAAYAREASPDREQAVALAVAGATAAHAGPTAARRSLLEQAGQIGFTPIASALTFGPPTDLAAGWDGTVWSIDSAGAPHVYDPVADSWQLFGSGIDAAVIINGNGPAVYFRGAEVYIADGSHTPQPIAQLWPNLPASYKLGIHGAFWSDGRLILFRGGTYVVVPWPAGSTVSAAQPRATPSSTPTAETTARPTAGATGTPGAPRTLSGTPTAEATSTPAAAAQQLFFAALAPDDQAARPSATSVANSSPSATRVATASPSATPTPATATATGTPTPTTAAATATPTPTTGTATPTAGPATPTAGTTAPTSTPGATATSLPKDAQAEVATPLIAAPLSSLLNWPRTPAWKDGVIDAAVTLTSGLVLLIRGNEVVEVLIANLPPSLFTANGPFPLSNFGQFQGLPTDWLTSGVDAGFWLTTSPGEGDYYIFKGPAVAVLPMQEIGGPKPPQEPSPTPAASAALVFAPLALAAADGTLTPTGGVPTHAVTTAPTSTRAVAPSSTSTSTPSPSSTATPGTQPTATPSTQPSAAPTASPSPTSGAPASPSPTPTSSLTATPGTPTPSGTPGGLQLPRAVGAAGTMHYIPEVVPWPASWHPVLQHAPSGRAGDLWAATTSRDVVNHDGTRWTTQPGSAVSVSAGVDGSVFAVSPNSNQLQQWTGTGWQQAAPAGSGLNQVAVGDSSHVWVRDSSNSVHQLQHGQLQAAPQLGTVAHVAANYDGTVWSCNGSDPHAFRFISEGAAAPQAVAAAASVHKVASTGFGTAHCLTQQGGTTQLYRYQSPYQFKTATSYSVSQRADSSPIERGLGQLYLSIQDGGDMSPGPPPVFHVVALDAQTGQEVSRSVPAPNNLVYTAPVFDPIHEVVIVGLTNYGQGTAPSQLLGLDARDLTRVRWTVTPPGGMNVAMRPTLVGTQLCFTDNLNTLAMYDTGLAATATPTLRWSQQLSISPDDKHQFAAPVLANGKVYTAWWVYATVFKYQQLHLVTANAADGSGFGQTAVNNSLTYPSPDVDIFSQLGSYQPLLVSATVAGQTHTYLYVNGGPAVWRVDVAAPDTAASYGLSSNTTWITSGLTSADGVLWFGDLNGDLYGLDGQLHPVPHTPAFLGISGQSQSQAIYTTPVVYTPAQGASTLIVSVTDTLEAGGLLLFDPATGNVVSVPTGQTALVTLSSAVSNGVVYAGGVAALGVPNSPTQVFGIRVDAAVQELRDFIVESQLMQDFDGQSTPNGVARYQTQLTLVDNNKAPLPHEAVKVWADKATTVRINNQTYAIGPGDSQYAALQTGTDGMLTIVSGNLANDGSDKPDMSAVPLRVWAGFMDPYERIVIQPDREFHNRVATAHDTAAGQPGADDPTRVNLQTTQRYGALQKGGSASGAALFTDAEKQQNQPQHVANAIQSATSAIGTVPPPGSNTRQAAWAVKTTATQGKYIPYADLPGTHYSAVNTAADRQVVVVQHSGLSYSSNNDKSAPCTYQPLSPAAATMAIDGLDGQDWSTSSQASPRILAAARTGTLHLGSWFGDFWDWLKGAVQSAAAQVTHVIVSIAEDVYVGVRTLVQEAGQWVARVFRQIVSGIEEIASAIGSFFIQLGKLIEAVIEALSVLFHFEEIIKTQQFLLQELNQRINGIPGNAAYPGLVAAIKTTAIPKIDAFARQAESTIGNTFTSLANQLGGGSSVTQFKGQGATSHTTFTAQPKSGGQSSSQATQCGWGMQKLKTGMPGSSSSATAAQTVGGAQGPVAAIEAAFTGFYARISSDGDLAAGWASLQQGGQALGQSTSISQFLTQAAAELIRAVGLVVQLGVAVGNALLDAFLNVIDSVVALVFDPESGLANQPLDIPVLSWLFQTLTGEPLTLATVLTLVAAIPITILWRIVEGEWPSQSLGAGLTTAQLGVSQVTVTIMTVLGGIFDIAGGICQSIVDLAAMPGEPLFGAATEWNAGVLTIGLYGSVINFPLLQNTGPPSDVAWASWGAFVGLAATGLLDTVGGSFSAGGPLSGVLEYLTPWLSFLLNVFVLACGVVTWIDANDPSPLNNLGLAVTVAVVLPGLVNAVKLTGAEGAFFVSIVDALMAWTSGILSFVVAGLSQAAASTPAGLASA